MILLAVDPGKRSGWAEYVDGLYHSSGVADGTSLVAVRNVVNTVSPNLLVVEDQYIGINPRAAIRLMETRCRWENVAAMSDASSELVNNRTWQAAYDMKFGDKIRMWEIAAKVARRPVEADEADAILIGQWYCVMRLQNGCGPTSLSGRGKVRRFGLRVDGRPGNSGLHGKRRAKKRLPVPPAGS